MITNIHIYPTTYIGETRILKETRSLLKLGLVDQILLVGIHEAGLKGKEEIYKGVQVNRLKLRFMNSPVKWIRYLSFVEFIIKSYIHVRKLNGEIINVHSLHVLPIGVLLKRKLKCRLIYDAHELETEVTGSKGILRYLSKQLENFCMRYVDELIVVSESIAKWYQETYKYKNVTTIYNVPLRPEANHINSVAAGLRTSIGVSKDSLLFIYQGLLTRARGVDELLEAFCGMNEQYHIVFMGKGPLKETILLSSQKYSNIHYHPPVAPDKVLSYTSEANVGIHIIKNTCLNHYYCLPNKIFEYLMSGIPFIVSNFPEMAQVTSDTGGGWTCRPDMEGLRDTISRITSEDILSKKVNIQTNLPKYGWQIEELKYIAIYKRLLKHA